MEARKTGLWDVVMSSDRAASFIPFMGRMHHEELWVLFLNNAMRPLAFERMSSGGWTSTTIDIKQILREVLLRRASGIIIFHNHPSESPTPSLNDVHYTERLKEACKMMDVELHDHFIVTRKRYYSFSNGRSTAIK